MIAPISGLGPIESLPTMGVTPISAPSRIDAPSETSQGGDFAGMLAGAVSSLNSQLTRADRLQEAAATGELADPTVAIVETQKADIALQMATQVRNKLVEGWQELSRMQV
jgi:flagellar hook-basal body complex protein FliE